MDTWIDKKMPYWAHQMVGACIGIIFCAWFVGATSEQVALIRLPAGIGLSAYMTLVVVGLVKGAMDALNRRA